MFSHGVRWTEGPAANALSLEGEIGVFQADSLHASIVEWMDRETPMSDVQVDCSKLSDLDSAALQVLVAWQQQLAGIGGSLRLINCPDSIRQKVLFAGFSNELFTTDCEAPRHAKTPTNQEAAR